MPKKQVYVVITTTDVKELFNLYGLDISDAEAEYILSVIANRMKQAMREEGENIIAFAIDEYRRGGFANETKEND